MINYKSTSKIKSKSRILILIAFCIAIYLFHPLNRKERDFISCKADISYQWNRNRLDLLITQYIQDGKGIISMSGILYEDDKTKSYLNKTVSFSYHQNNNFYYFRSELIMDSPQTTMNSSDQQKWLPDFFIDINKPLLQEVRPYGKNAWIFYSGSTPLFVCEKIH